VWGGRVGGWVGETMQAWHVVAEQLTQRLGRQQKRWVCVWGGGGGVSPRPSNTNRVIAITTMQGST
jgi:hypothetical protein